MIVLQLKSTQEQPALDNISSIIRAIEKEHGYRIRGHEVHQVSGVMRNTLFAKRAGTVARFCRQNRIEYLSYHAPILGPGDNIWDAKRREKVKDSVRKTVQEAQSVCEQADIASAVVVFHLTSYVSHGQIPATPQEKTELIEAAGKEFLAFFAELDTEHCTLAVENTYPRCKGEWANIGPFHPLELARLAKNGVMTTLDFAHYHLYSNYVQHGTGNAIGDIDRQLYGEPLSWQECIRALGSSLVQLHVSDAKGMGVEGEALPLGKGDIPLAEVLSLVNHGRTVQATLELGGGHLNGARLQLEGARWLMENAREMF